MSCYRRGVPSCLPSPARATSLPGWAYVPILASPEATFYPPAHERSGIDWPKPCAWLLSRWTTANPNLGQFYRRIWAKHGPAGATAIATRKLVRILYYLRKTHQPYDESVFALEGELHRRRLPAPTRKADQGLRFPTSSNRSLGHITEQFLRR